MYQGYSCKTSKSSTNSTEADTFTLEGLPFFDDYEIYDYDESFDTYLESVKQENLSEDEGQSFVSFSEAPKPTKRAKRDNLKEQAHCTSRWTKQEDIFLTGVVMDCYYRRHSLKASMEERNEAKRLGVPVNTLVWSKIHAKYCEATARHYRLTGKTLASRSAGALQKHWKQTGRKRKASDDEDDVDYMPLTKQYERIWEEKYNCNYILTCSAERFQKLLKTSQLVTRKSQRF